ncbi:MAG: extensin family protein [Alphaproteobacteria bacterium]|nr:extensin family protein [Alphaproteobacteria bacterium]
MTILLLGLLACGSGDLLSRPLPDGFVPATDDTGPVDDTGPIDDTGPAYGGGFIGSPCASDADCDYDGGICLLDGFPNGSCSMECDRYCPDADGFPTTFCVERGEFPDDAPLVEGGCLSRCDLGLFPETGCRDGYGCVVTTRANEPETQTYACLPDRPSDLTDCHVELAARGVAFEPTVIAPESPSTHPDLTCFIEDPVYVRSPVHDVDLLYYDGTETERVLAACDMAHALTDTIDDVAPYGVTALRHIGTYNCRVISGTDTLSRHAFADAIDIYGFDFSDGTQYTLVDDWEHDTSSPQGPGARFLYDAAYRWHDDYIWTIILTPNYNSAHDNHFHVDLTPGSDYIGATGPWFIGPAPYDD